MQRASQVFKRSVFDLQGLSEVCILGRNGAAHFRRLKDLEDSVKHLEKAILLFPQLKETHPHQCETIELYWELKKKLPECFTDKLAYNEYLNS